MRRNVESDMREATVSTGGASSDQTDAQGEVVQLKRTGESLVMTRRWAIALLLVASQWAKAHP